MDLTQLSDSDLMALKSGDLTKLSDSALMSLKGASSPAPQQSFTDQLKHQAGLFSRAGVTTLTGLPAMAGDAINSVGNLGISGINALTGKNIAPLQLPSQMIQRGMDSLGFSQPQDAGERVVQAATSAMGGTGPSVALGGLLAKGAAPLMQSIGSALQTAPGVQAASAAGSGAAGQTAAELGGGPISQIASAILGGGATALAATGAKSLMTSAPTQQTQLAAALRDQAENQKPMPRYSQDVNGQVVTTLDTPPKPRFKINTDGTATEIQKPTPVPKFESPSAPASMHPTQDQLANIDLLKKIGLNEQRASTVSGDKFQAGIEYENGKLSNNIGEVTRDQLAKEQSALKNYATGIIDKTGAVAPTPESAGQVIRAPMSALSGHFDNAIGKLYDAAKIKAGDMGEVDPKNLNALIKNPDFRETLLSSSDGTALLGSIDRQVKRFQGLPIEGEPLPQAPNTVNSAENLRKWLNSQWSPTNSRMMGMVKEAIDTDVAQVGGKGVFDEARKLHALRKNTLDNPNGISKLLASDGPNGINQAIPDELVGSKLLAMPTGQFNHIITTLKGLPEELQESGQQALAQIKGELAKTIYQAGDRGGNQQGGSIWNASNVTRALNANKSKMSSVFSPEELDSFKTLHDAGHLIQTPTAYKGAAAQGYNYIQKGVLAGLPIGGASLGSMLAGPVGGGMGSMIGGGATALVKPRIDNAMAQRLAEQLKNPMPTFKSQ